MANEKESISHDHVSLKEYFEKLLEQRDLFYAEKIKYLETRIVSVDDKHTAAVLAAKAIAETTFQSSEKAILKSEEGQRLLNEKNNEFRGQLRDQAEHLMPRTESLSNWKSATEKITELKEQTESKFDLIRKEIQVLREYRSEGGGKSAGMQQSWAVLIAAIGIVGTLVSIFVGLTVLLRR